MVWRPRVGLPVHEAPGIGSRHRNSLGRRWRVEPRFYLPERDGVQIEDTLVVGEDGSEPLTRYPPRELAALT